MSEKQVVRTEISSVEPIKDSDFINLYKLSNGNQVVWAKAMYNQGDRVLYIRDQSILPEPLIKQLGLTGKLAGKAKNRVKAIKLRGVYSEGLILRDTPDVTDEELDDYLGVTKYIPKVPATLEGKVFYIGTENIVSFEVERPDISELDLEEAVISITEKIHGTNIRIGKLPFSDDRLFGKDKNIYICSKGLGNKGLVFENTVNNAYTQMFYKYQDAIENFAVGQHLIGEVYGNGIQDLTYGQEGVDMLVIKLGVFAGSGKDPASSFTFVPQITVESSKGFFDYPTLKDFYGINIETLDSKVPKAKHMAEGIVAWTASRHYIKRVSQRYKLRNNGTEFN